jgi:hypothetical protein
MEGDHASGDEQQGEGENEQLLVKREIDDSADHY